MAMTLDVDLDILAPSGGRIIAGFATASNNYQAAGETMDVSSYFGGSPVVMINGDDGYVPQHDRGTAAAATVQFFVSGANNTDPLNEVANGTDLSAVICPFVAFGNSTAG